MSYQLPKEYLNHKIKERQDKISFDLCKELMEHYAIPELERTMQLSQSTLRKLCHDRYGLSYRRWKKQGRSYLNKLKVIFPT